MVRDKFSHFTDKRGLSFFSSNGKYLHCSLCADDVALAQGAWYTADSSKDSYAQIILLNIWNLNVTD